MNQENTYSKGCKVKYLLKSKTSVDLVDFNIPVQLKKHIMLGREGGNGGMVGKGGKFEMGGKIGNGQKWAEFAGSWICMDLISLNPVIGGGCNFQICWSP